MSSYSYSYFRPVGNWNTKIEIEHDYFSSVRNVEAGLYGLWLALLIGLAITALILKKPRSAVTFSIFKVYKFWLVLVLFILCYAFDFAYLIIEQSTLEVTEAYILVNTIFSFLFYPASIILLAVIFSLLFRLFQQPGASYQRYRGILWFNYAFCGVLFIFYIATFGLTLHTLYTEVYDGEATVYYVSGRPVQYVLIVVYDLLYTIAALEILAASFVLLSTHRNYHNNSSMPLLFLTLIATPLLLSSLFRLGYNATYLLSVAAAQPYISVTLASTIITGLALILTFSGLLAIGVKAEDPIDQFDLEQRALQEGHYAPSHAAAPGHEPYSNELNDKGVRSSEANGGWDLRDRIEGWKPSFRRGGKSGLGLRTGF